MSNPDVLVSSAPRRSSSLRHHLPFVALAFLAPSFAGASLHAIDAPTFVRGDANSDGRVSFADVFAILGYLHQGLVIDCVDAADADDSGDVAATDFVYLLGSLFLGHAPPPAPWPRAGVDPTPDALECSRFLGAGADVAGGGAGDPGDGLAPGAGVAIEDCFPHNGGADTEFILFLFRDVFVYPGQTGVRVPIVMSNRRDVQGLTLSVQADPPRLRLEEIDFSGTVLGAARARSSWSHTFDGLVGDGYLSSIIALDLGEGQSTLGELTNQTIAHLQFSVPEDLPIGASVDVRFAEIPEHGSFSPIRNEIVRRGRSIGGQYCGMRIRVVPEEMIFLRGDTDRSWSIEVSDSVDVLLYLFTDRVTALPCPDAADADDNGKVELSDAIQILNSLFKGWAQPWPPLPSIDIEPDALGCVAH